MLAKRSVPASRLNSANFLALGIEFSLSTSIQNRRCEQLISPRTIDDYCKDEISIRRQSNCARGGREFGRKLIIGLMIVTRRCNRRQIGKKKREKKKIAGNFVEAEINERQTRSNFVDAAFLNGGREQPRGSLQVTKIFSFPAVTPLAV